MKFKKLFSVNILAIIILLLACSSFAQNKVTQQDINAVINYMNLKVKDSPYKSYVPGQDKNAVDRLQKGNALKSFVEGEKHYLMNANNVTVDVYNYGGIGGGYPSANIREIGDLVWHNLPYIFQFSPIVGASVPDPKDNTKRIHIISDGLYDYDGYREESPTGERWVFKPLPGYADPNQPYMASNPAFDADRDGKPDSWPREWYNSTLGQYVWPGYLKQGENNADLEVYWAMDDRDNKEFKYYPYLNDTTKRGLGIQVDGRAFQWSNSLAANTVFFVYTITNKSDKDLDSVFFGIYGDPDIGGKDNKDDRGFFIPPYGASVQNIPVYARSMVYFWDQDMTGDRGLPLGYLGCKFLESPGNPNDGIDNDGDGMIDERQDDGIDNDNDWNVETDDVGVDGIPNTGDTGEGDGVPTSGKRLPDGTPDPLAPGEPNFEYTDLDEADQIGLTSFNSWSWGEDKIYNDESIWYRNTPGNFGEIQQNADINFTFGSGYISLKKGETKRISMAFLFGQDLSDLLTTAATVQDIYNKNYKFFKPPELPTVTIVPDDKKVTLYWDSKAEQSTDPITGKDFEGYVIYRSTTPTFEDILKVTDGKGADFLYEPLKDLSGFEAKWDLVNGWKGYHPVPYQGRGLHYYLGDDNGLVHSFVDSNNVINGQTYYYAVVAYDHGDSVGIPTSETTKKISADPITGKLRFDTNTGYAVPGPRTSGYMYPPVDSKNITHQGGYGTGEIKAIVLNDLVVGDKTYKLSFMDSIKVTDTTSVAGKNYSILADDPVTEEFYVYDTKFAQLSHSDIIEDNTISVKDNSGKVYTPNVDYVLNTLKGAIKRTANSSMPNNSKFTITYKYYPVFQSTALSYEDNNPVFDGVLVKVQDHPALMMDSTRTGWKEGGKNIGVTVGISSVGQVTRKKYYPGDYKLTFSDQYVDSSVVITSGRFSKIPVKFSLTEFSTGIEKRVQTVFNEKGTKDSSVSRGDEIVFFLPNASGLQTDTLSWSVTINKANGADSLVPGKGDVFYLYTKKPFNKNDNFIIKTTSSKVAINMGASVLDKIIVVPNPYVAANDLEPANRLSSQNRGERRIYFDNLPQKCTLRIFTLSGEHVRTIEHSAGPDNAREFWNLLNKDGFGVAYGIYIAHIDAPGIGEKIIKFALIK